MDRARLLQSKDTPHNCVLGEPETQAEPGLLFCSLYLSVAFPPPPRGSSRRGGQDRGNLSSSTPTHNDSFQPGEARLFLSRKNGQQGEVGGLRVDHRRLQQERWVVGCRMEAERKDLSGQIGDQKSFLY